MENESIKDYLRRDGLEKLKRGGWADRLQHLYVTRLKNYAVFRFARKVYGSKIVAILSLVFFYVFLMIPCIICIFGYILVGMWKARKEDSIADEMAKQYINRERGWH